VHITIKQVLLRILKTCRPNSVCIFWFPEWFIVVRGVMLLCLFFCCEVRPTICKDMLTSCTVHANYTRDITVLKRYSWCHIYN
jgi:hypothetical protein